MCFTSPSWRAVRHLHEPEDLARDEAEGVRLAYVAATRARDLLIVPAVGDEEREGWIDPLNRAIYTPDDVRRQQVAAPGCPAFKSFEEGKRWTLVDFKTDEEFRSAAPYQRQVGLYGLVVEKALSTSTSAFLVRI